MYRTETTYLYKGETIHLYAKYQQDIRIKTMMPGEPTPSPKRET